MYDKSTTAEPTGNQAGDPFGESQGTSEPVDENSNEGRAAAIKAIQNEVTPDPEQFDEALSALEIFEEEERAEAKAEESTKKLTINDIREIVKTTAEAVTVANANLDKARKAYALASLLEVECGARPTLVEMNRIQVKVTATEVRRKGRAMKALGELGFGDPKRKPHPQLF